MLMKNNDDIVGVTVNHGRSVLLTWPNGTPLRAGEIDAGATVKFNPDTGVIHEIRSGPVRHKLVRRREKKP